jgi:hypothetical protein
MNGLSRGIGVLLVAIAAVGCAGEDGSSGSNGPEPGHVPPPCKAGAAAGIEVAPTDIYGGLPYALGYPPYAVDACSLAYVAPDGSLRLRDLTASIEWTLAEAAEEPRRPSVGEYVVAWEATEGGRRVVRVWTGEAAVTVKGAFDHAGEPRASANGVIFTGWRAADEAGDTDVFLFVPGQAEAKPIAEGPGQQRFADISRTHVAYSDFSEDSDGRFDENAFDLSDVVVVERATGTASRRMRAGKQAFPMLGAEGRVGYLEWGPQHPEPKFSAYTLLMGEAMAEGAKDEAVVPIETLVPYVRPVARGTFVEWVAWPNASAPSLWRRRADLSEPAVEVPSIEGMEMYGPSATQWFTVLATRTAEGTMVLRAAER